MIRSLTLAAAVALTASAALAQTTVLPVRPATPGAPVAPVAPGAPPVSPGNPSTMTGSSNPAINAPNAEVPGSRSPVPATLEAGSNSFTEGQARDRIQDAGFMNVIDLRKDDQGIWRGKGMKAGKSYAVGIDYKGNINWQ